MRIIIFVLFFLFSSNSFSQTSIRNSSGNSLGISKFNSEVIDSTGRYVGSFFYAGPIPRVMMVINGKVISLPVGPARGVVPGTTTINNAALTFLGGGSVVYALPDCAGQPYIQAGIEEYNFSPGYVGSNALAGTHPVAVFPAYQPGSSGFIAIGTPIVDLGFSRAMSFFNGSADFPGCINVPGGVGQMTVTPMTDRIEINDIARLPLSIR